MSSSESNPSAERLAALRLRFKSTLAARLAAVESHAARLRVGQWPEAPGEALLGEVHSLAGSAGLFGQERIGEAAGALERTLLGVRQRKVITAVDIAQLHSAVHTLVRMPVTTDDAS